MSSKHKLQTSFHLGENSVLLNVAFSYVAGRPETPPAYDHGGLPADPPEVEITAIEWSRENTRTNTFDWHKIDGPLFDFIADDGSLYYECQQAAEEDLIAWSEP